MEDKILQILDNVRYWDSCPDDYKETIRQFLADKKQSLQFLQSRVIESVCDNCEPVSGYYLGMTCPKCLQAFRSIKTVL